MDAIRSPDQKTHAKAAIEIKPTDLGRLADQTTQQRSKLADPDGQPSAAFVVELRRSEPESATYKRPAPSAQPVEE